MNILSPLSPPGSRESPESLVHPRSDGQGSEERLAGREKP